jgi:PKD repeat protein
MALSQIPINKIIRFSRLFLLSSVLTTLICVLFFTNVASAVDITLAWDANIESDLAGYFIYYRTNFMGLPDGGTGAQEGDSPILIPLEALTDPNYPEYTIHGLTDTDTYFLVATAYNAEDYESGYSNEVYQLCSNPFPPAVNAEFTASPTSGYRPLSVSFPDQSTGIIDTRSWEFGDGGRSDQQDPSHVFGEVGSYTVRLIVTGPDGCDDEIKTDFITVYTPPVGADGMETGQYETSGKGKKKTTTFVLTGTFNVGDEVTIHTHVVDRFGQAVPYATVDLTIIGPETTNLTAGPSDDTGVAEAKWETSTPKGGGKKGKGKPQPGTTPGTYTATVVGVTADGYEWDQFETSCDFIIN